MAAPNLAKTRDKFTKKFGAHSISSASDTEALSFIPYGISAGCLTLDLALGRPGFPAGRLTEIIGKTNQGKSTLIYHALAECQRRGGVSVLMETEQAYEAWRLRQLGVDTDALQVPEPKNVENLYEEMEFFIHDLRVTQRFRGPMTLAVDTIANLQSAVEEEGGYDDKFMAVAAKAHAQGWRKFIWTLARYKVVLLFANQLVSTMQQYGDPFQSYGGSAIHKNASVRIRVTSQKKDLVRISGQAIGAWTQAYLVKNKLAAPFRDAKYLLHFTTGIDPIEDLWQAAKQLRVLTSTQKGAKFSLGEKSIILTRDKFDDFVMTKFKSVEGCRERLTKVAMEQQLLRPYGEK